MSFFLAHRGSWKNPAQQNSLDALSRALAAGYGIETDLRSFRGELVLSHDPVRGAAGVPRFTGLVDLLRRHPNSPVFINVKEDGLAPLLARFHVELTASSAVFFDMSVPEIVRYSRVFPASMLATRVSDVEPVPAAADLTEWFWVDGFHRDLTTAELSKLRSRYAHSFAFVSPALHGRSDKPLFAAVAEEFSEEQWLWCADRCPGRGRDEAAATVRPRAG